MRVAGIIRNSVVNGIGIRDVIFLQGCKHHCLGCHNPQTWSLDGGKSYSRLELVEEFKDSPHDVTISGGEPLLQFSELIQFMRYMNEKYGKRFWLYTGYTFEEISYYQKVMLAKYVDVLVDGRFEIEKKDLTLQFRGSSNQRLINLPISVEMGVVIRWEDK